MDTTVDAFPPPAERAENTEMPKAEEDAELDLSGTPIQERLKLQAERHHAMLEEREGLDYVHDALVQVVYSRDKASERLAEQKREWTKFEFKLKDLYNQWKALEATLECPSAGSKLLLKLKHPRLSTEQSLASLALQRRAREEEHQHAFWQGQEYQRSIASLEERLAGFEDEVAHYERQTNRHAELTRGLQRMYARVFAGQHPEYPAEMELRDRIDVMAAHSLEFGQKLELERKILAEFPLMLEDAERAERQFAKAQWSSREAREHEVKAKHSYQRARARESTIRRLKPGVAKYPSELPSFSALKTGEWADLLCDGYSERRHFCADMAQHMRTQWTKAKADAAELAAGVEELNRQVEDQKEQLENMRCRILLNVAAEMGLREEVEAERERERERNREGEEVAEEEALDPIDPDLEDGESVFATQGGDERSELDDAPPEYSKLAEAGAGGRVLPAGLPAGLQSLLAGPPRDAGAGGSRPLPPRPY